MGLTKRQQQKEDTRKRIVQAAYRVYGDRGFMATTSDIAKDIGVSHGTIFVHFATREELLICVLEDFGSRICGRLHELVRVGDGVCGVLGAHLSAIEEFEEFYVRLVSENRLLPGEARNTFVAIQSTIAFHLMEVIGKERVGNSIRELSDHFIFNTWLGLIHYYLQNSDIFAPDTSVIGRYRDELLTNFLELIKK